MKSNNKDQSMLDKILLYEKEIKQKDKLIVELKNMLENERIKVSSYESREKNISEQYKKFEEYKELLNKSVSYLEESIVTKEEKINELEKINIAKENEIINLKQKINEKNGSVQNEDEILFVKDQMLSIKNDVSELSKKSSLLDELYENLKDDINSLECRRTSKEE